MLDYSFVNKPEDDEAEEAALDYSFVNKDERVNEATGESLLKQRETYDLTPDVERSNFEKAMERVALMQTGGITGLAEMAATTDPSYKDALDKALESYSPEQIMENPERYLPATTGPIGALGVMLANSTKPLVDYAGGMVAKGWFDIADLFTDGNARGDVRTANEIIRKEAQGALGGEGLQYTGSDAGKFGWEVVEGTANMVPALAVGWMSRNPGLSLGMMGVEVAGNTYNEYMEKTGGDHERSVLAAQFHTAAEIIPETIPVLAILRKTKAGEGLKRMLEATIGEGAQEMLTEILQGTYDRTQLEGMSLKDAIMNIDWGNVAHAGAIGFFVGGTLATPGMIADQTTGRKRYDQQGQPAELFKPTVRAGGGLEAMPATKNGKPVSDVYITRDGQVIRDTNAIPLTDNALDTTFDVSATIAGIQEDIGYKDGIIANAMNPYGLEKPVEMPLGKLEPIKPGGIVGDQMGIEGDLVEQQAGEVRPEVEPEITADLTEQTMEVTPVEPAPDVGWGPVTQPEMPEEQPRTPKPEQPQTALPGEEAEVEVEQKKGEPWQPVEVPTLDEEAHEAATSPQNGLEEPTDGQKEAGNYKKGHVKIQGMDVAVENPAGSKRKPEWPTLKQHYGYLKGTEGADSTPGAAPHEREQVDVFVRPEEDGGPIPDDNPVFIIDQATEDGKSFDEHKVMMGFTTEQEARDAYMANFTKGWKGLANISQVTPEELKIWLNEGSQRVEYGPPIQKAATAKEQALRETATMAAEKPALTEQEKADVEEIVGAPRDVIREDSDVYSEDEVSTDKRTSIGPVAEPKNGQRNLLAPKGVPGKTAKTQASDSFNIRYEQVETGTLRARSDTANTPEEIAHLTASLRKHAQEVFYAVVTDVDGKVLNVIRHSKGTRDGASVYPLDVVGAIANTPGGQNFWFIHNHPSTTASPSQADLRITETLVNATEGLGMDFKGHVIIAGTDYAYFNQGYYVSETADTGKIPAGRRSTEVGVTERILRMRKPGDRVTLTSPNQTRMYIRDLESESGLLLLNNRNVAIGVLSLSPEEMMKLRDGKQVRRILSAIDSTNASAGISFIKGGTQPGTEVTILQNLGNYLARVPNFRVLDALHSAEGGGLASLAETGESMGSKDELFYRRAEPHTELNGKEISYEVEVEDTGKTYTVTVDAGATMRDIDTRLNALRELRNCI